MTPEERAQLEIKLADLQAKRKRLAALPKSLENANEGYDPTGSFGQNLLEGIGRGMDRVVRGAVNLALPESITPKFASTERIRELEQLDKPLMATGGGKVGSFVGESIPLALVGGGIGTGLKGATTALRGIRGAQYASSLPTRAILEGAVTSAIMADPEKQGEAGLQGAALGGVLGTLGKVLSRTGKGLVQKSDAVEDLQTFARTQGKPDLFVPLAQSADKTGDLTTRIARSGYQGLLPYIPGTTGKMERQVENLADEVREMALRKGDYAGILTPDLVKNPQRAIKELTDRVDADYFNTVRQYAFEVPNDLSAQITARIKQVRPDVDATTEGQIRDMIVSKFQRYMDPARNAAGQFQITGNNILEAKNAVSREIPLMDAPSAKKLAGDVHKIFDDLIDTQLTQGGVFQNLQDLDTYKRARDAWAVIRPLADTVSSARKASGKFNAAQLISHSQPASDLEHLGQLANEVAKERVGLPTAAGRMMGRATGLLTSGVGFATAPITTTSAILGGNILAGKGAQKLLMGDTRAQKYLVELLRRNPNAARWLDSAIRAPMTGAVGDQQNAP